MDIKTIYIHHSAIPKDGTKQFNRVNEFHKTKFNFPSITGYFVGYTYFLETDGELRTAREEGEEQAAQKGENKNTISICLAGNMEIDYPTQEQKTSLQAFLSDKTTRYGLTREQIKGHRESRFASTKCPGVNLMSWIEEYRKPKGLESLMQQIEWVKQQIAKLIEQLKGMS